MLLSSIRQLWEPCRSTLEIWLIWGRWAHRPVRFARLPTKWFPSLFLSCGSWCFCEARWMPVIASWCGEALLTWDDLSQLYSSLQLAGDLGPNSFSWNRREILGWMIWTAFPHLFCSHILSLAKYAMRDIQSNLVVCWQASLKQKVPDGCGADIGFFCRDILFDMNQCIYFI